MGATGRYTDKPTKQVIIEELTWNEPGFGGARVVDISMKPGVAYVAWERWYEAREGQPASRFVMGVVVINSRGNGEVITKVVTEDMGPCETECPASILDKLSPVDAFASPKVDGEGGYEWATKWRFQCRLNIARKKQAPGDGAIIRFADEIAFTDGVKADTFQIRKCGRKVRFKIVGGETWAEYCISNWETREFTVRSHGDIIQA